MSRSTASLLRQVAAEERSFAIEHFGRAVALLIPLGGRVAVRNRGQLVYEMPKPVPLRDLTETQVRTLRVLDELGACTMDDLIPRIGSFGDVAGALGSLEYLEVPLVHRPNGWWWGITDEGRRHLEALGP